MYYPGLFQVAQNLAGEKNVFFNILGFFDVQISKLSFMQKLFIKMIRVEN